MIKGSALKFNKKQLNDLTDRFLLEEDMIEGLDNSLDFREKCMRHGYYLSKLYPIYHQGWELDEWAAIGIKENKTYWLETDHGSLRPMQISNNPILRWINGY